MKVYWVDGVFNENVLNGVHKNRTIWNTLKKRGGTELIF